VAGEIASFRIDQIDRSAHVHASTWRDSGKGSPRFPRSAHAGVEIAWCTSGCVAYEVGARTFELAAGSVVVLPEGVEHRTRLLPGTAATSIKVDAALALEVAEETARRLEPALVPRTDVLARLGAILTEPARRARGGDPVDDVARAFVRRILEPAEESPPSRRDPRIERAIRCAEARIAEPLEIADLARAAGMSRYHFSRAFRAQLGLSPYQWLLQKRVEHAAALLGRRRVSVTEAAFEVGFSDLSRFARAFREQFGCAPSAFAA
jgi:AraC-like DNA-binding protein